MELAPAEIEERLDRWPVARLATTGAGGRPHQVPIVFVRVGDLLWSPVDGKPKTGRELARVRNIAERPDVCLLLDHYAEDWKTLWWIRIDARARVVCPDVVQQDAPFLAAQQALRAKYPQYEDVALVQSPPTMLSFEVVEVRSWCTGPTPA